MANAFAAVSTFQHKFIKRRLSAGNLYGPHLYLLRILHIGFRAIQLRRISHTYKIDMIHRYGEGEEELIAIGRDSECQRLDVLLLAIQLLTIKPPDPH